MQVVLKRVTDARSHWIVACDADMDPCEESAKAPPDGRSTHRTVGVDTEAVSKVLDYFVVRSSRLSGSQRSAWWRNLYPSRTNQ